MTYRRTRTLAEVTQDLDAIKDLLDVVAAKQTDITQRQADITRRLEYVEDAVEELSKPPKKGKS